LRHFLSFFRSGPVDRQCGTISPTDEALSIAHSHLAHWNPVIQFFGLPDEAQQGFALEGAKGEHGELVFQRPDIWMLRWKAPPQAVYESWSVALPDPDAASDTAHRNRAP
jgi:hypothetical protein